MPKITRSVFYCLFAMLPNFVDIYTTLDIVVFLWLSG